MRRRCPAAPSDARLALWRGDITTLKVDAIVNAANSGLEGCWSPNHACIDNCIHTYAGVQLRLKCHELMTAQGYPEPTGQAKITPGYNLPAAFVLHTVGPIIDHPLTAGDGALLASCYSACLRLAAPKRLPERGVLLHLHRRLPLSPGQGGGDRRADREGVSGQRSLPWRAWCSTSSAPGTRRFIKACWHDLPLEQTNRLWDGF